MIKEFLSVIVPCYNEALVIEETNRRLVQVLSTYFLTYEIIYVNDGSKDLTHQKLHQISNENLNVKIINFSRNFGHQAVYLRGFPIAMVI